MFGSLAIYEKWGVFKKVMPYNIGWTVKLEVGLCVLGLRLCVNFGNM